MKLNIILFALLFILSIPICSAPLLMWHFDEVHTKVDLSYELEHHNDTEPHPTNSITGYATGIMQDKRVAITAPLLVIPFVIFVLLFFSQFGKSLDVKSKEEIDEETDEDVVERFVVNQLIQGDTEESIRSNLEMRGYDGDIVNKVFDDLEDDSDFKV